MMGQEKKYILALDQGTTSSRALLYTHSGEEVAAASRPLSISFPQSGWVEQDPADIWRSQLEAMQEVLQGIPADSLSCIGISNQRETTVVWERSTGRSPAPAIVWQCRRSDDICRALRQAGHEKRIAEKTGLVIDAYFSASKMQWLQDNIPGLREAVERQELVFGTVDSWLLYCLSGRTTFKTELSNASRTMLCNIHTGAWDEELLKKFSLTAGSLCEIVPSVSSFCTWNYQGRNIPVTGVLGDQQASLLGHGCCSEHSAKCTFGTGAFLLMNSGSAPTVSSAGMLSTIAWRLPEQKLSYALEGSVFIAGSLIQWLRDKLGLLQSAEESEAVAASVEDSGGVMIIPAFVGLGAPYWNSEVRGAIFGLTRDSSRAHLVRAALESVAQQIADLLEAPEFSMLGTLQIDGGMSRNSLFCQILADLTGRNISRAASPEATARGAAMAAALGAGIYPNLSAATSAWKRTDSTLYQPHINEDDRRTKRSQWKAAVSGLLATPL
jgi:glycerol kinase